MIYANQRMTSKKYGRSPPTYTKQELMDWFINQSVFQQLWDAWVASGYEKELSPSVDRKINTEGYTLNNIQLVTWKQNLINQKNQNKSGEYPHTDSKPVRQFTLEGDFVADHTSLSNAGRAVSERGKGQSNIAAVCNGKWLSAYGFKWKWL